VCVLHSYFVVILVRGVCVACVLRAYSFFAYVCVCVLCMRMFVCACVCLCVHAYVCVCMFVCALHAYVCVCMRMFVCACVLSKCSANRGVSHCACVHVCQRACVHFFPCVSVQVLCLLCFYLCMRQQLSAFALQMVLCKRACFFSYGQMMLCKQGG
jgi:hypothetical protein